MNIDKVLKDDTIKVPNYDVVVNLPSYDFANDLALMINKTNTIASIGKKHVLHTINETSRPKHKNIKLINQSKLFITEYDSLYEIGMQLQTKMILITPKKTNKIIKTTGNQNLLVAYSTNNHFEYPINVMSLVRQLLPKRFNNQIEPKLSIISRTYNRLEYTMQMVKQVHDLAGSANYEHIIIDQGSTDGTREWLKSIKKENFYDKLRIILNNSNIGDAGGIHQGIKIAKYKYVMQLDNDCMPITYDFINNLVDMIEVDPTKYGAIMMYREGVNTHILSNDKCIINNHECMIVSKVTCAFIVDKNNLTDSSIWSSHTKIGWGFRVSKLLKSKKLQLAKALDVKLMHIDGTNLQSRKFPLYHSSVANQSTNYRLLSY